MYDTLSLSLPLSDLDASTALSELSLKLNNVTEHHSFATGATTISGKLKSLNFAIRETNIYITGSLCKYHFGNNQQTLNINDTKEAIESLTDFTGLPIADASVYRIDFAENYILEQPEHLYYDHLGAATYYKRVPENNGIYYKSSRRQLVFYGKVHEQKYKNEVILPVLEGKNVLRYEMRLNKKIPTQLKLPPIKAAMLYEPMLYRKLLERYEAEYLSISKKSQLIMDTDVLGQKNGLWNQILLKGAMEMGGEDALLKMVDNAKRAGGFSSAMAAGRMKKKISSIFQALGRA